MCKLNQHEFCEAEPAVLLHFAQRIKNGN